MRILATAKTSERLIRYIKEYTFANEVNLKILEGKTRVELVYIDFGVRNATLSDRFEVVKHRGGFAFVNVEANTR